MLENKEEIKFISDTKLSLNNTTTENKLEKHAALYERVKNSSASNFTRDGMNFNEQLITKYINELEANSKSQETRRVYKYVLSNLESHVQKPFNNMTKEDIMNFFNAMKTGKINGRLKP